MYIDRHTDSSTYLNFLLQIPIWLFVKSFCKSRSCPVFFQPCCCGGEWQPLLSDIETCQTSLCLKISINIKHSVANPHLTCFKSFCKSRRVTTPLGRHWDLSDEPLSKKLPQHLLSPSRAVHFTLLLAYQMSFFSSTPVVESHNPSWPTLRLVRRAFV